MTMNYILLIDDDYQLVNRVRLNLQENLTAKVEVATTLTQARYQLLQREYDLVILERDLSDGDGLELLLSKLNYFHQPKFLILSRRGLMKEREQGLQAGALDYLSKPFSMLELIIKVKRYLGQETTNRQELIFVDRGLKFLPQRKQLIVDNQVCPLTASDNKIMQALVTNYGRVISYSVLCQLLDLHEEQSAGSLRVKIHRLRHKLGRFKNLIANCNQLGYCLNVTSKPKVISKIA